MLLSEIFGGLEGVLSVSGEADITGLAIDSRVAGQGDLFFCQSGAHFDGHDFAPAVAARGAAALVVSRKLDVPLPQVVVRDVRVALSLAAARFYGEPAKGMTIVGVTGTKGKTTTTYLIKAILDSAGHKTGLIGSVSTIIGKREIPGNLTTPEAIDFQRTLRMMRDEGCDALVMEVSANALTLKRVYGVEFDVGIFTNFSQDHLDFYGTMDNYFAAKEQMFTCGMVKTAVFNADDDRVEGVRADSPVTYFGVADHKQIYAADIDLLERGISYTLCAEGRRIPVRLRLAGLFNVYNSMAAACAAMALGCTDAQIAEGLAAVQSVPGRIELLPTDTPYRVILDHAHSPASLENILKAVRQMTQGRMIVLFGCGGDRDHEKRPIMGRIAGELADYTIITSDNPRSEEPMDIIGQIEAGIRGSGADYTVIENREQAIRQGLAMARPGDTLILAGKGHETYQEIKGVKRPFDERLIVARLLAEGAGEEGGCK